MGCLMTHKPYPRYKESGVEWLGEIPEHWEVKRLRFVAKFNPSKTEAALLNRSTEVSFLPMEAIGNDGSLDLERTRPIGELETGYTYFREGDVTIAKITPCFENGKGAIMRGLFGGIGFGTTELIVARPKIEKATSQYLYQIFISSPFRKFGEAAMYGAGGQKRVPDDFIQDFSTAFPPLSEQHTIASFLDQETSRIDTLISEKERLISLLQEYRQALISHAVTKGLDPNVKMKDSGVEWLGEIPEHWEIKRTKWLFTERDDRTDSGNEELLTVSHLTGVTSRAEKDVNMFMAESLEGYKRCQTGDLVINTLWAWMGAMGITRKEGIVSPAYNVYEPNATIDPEYIDFLVRIPSFVEELTRYSKGVWLSRLRLYPEGLYQVCLPVPPIQEQLSIASFLDQKTSHIDTLISEARKFIDLLKEYHSSLITAAVTGKIDVREDVPSGSEKREIAHE